MDNAFITPEAAITGGFCLHINEPNCEVKRRIENNEILKSRYENYLLFVKEIQETKKKY